MQSADTEEGISDGRESELFPTMRAFTASEKKIYQEIQKAADRITEPVTQQKSLPARVPLAQAQPGEAPVKLSTERKHLTNVLKLVAYQISSICWGLPHVRHLGCLPAPNTPNGAEHC